MFCTVSMGDPWHSYVSILPDMLYITIVGSILQNYGGAFKCNFLKSTRGVHEARLVLFVVEQMLEITSSRPIHKCALPPPFNIPSCSKVTCNTSLLSNIRHSLTSHLALPLTLPYLTSHLALPLTLPHLPPCLASPLTLPCLTSHLALPHLSPCLASHLALPLTLPHLPPCLASPLTLPCLTSHLALPHLSPCLASPLTLPCLSPCLASHLALPLTLPHLPPCLASPLTLPCLTSHLALPHLSPCLASPLTLPCLTSCLESSSATSPFAHSRFYSPVCKHNIVEN